MDSAGEEMGTRMTPENFAHERLGPSDVSVEDHGHSNLKL